MKPPKKPLAPDATGCPSCQKTTRWLTMKSGRLHCEECGDVFPCIRECKHIDCAVTHGRDRVEIPGFGTVRVRVL